MSTSPDDPILVTLRTLRSMRDDADAGIRLLLAYGREVATPRPYRLSALAEAAGMSLSGVRTAYHAEDIKLARAAAGGTS